MNLPTRGVSIIVPTYHEGENLRPLVERVFAATSGAGIDAEVIIVDDDSRDGTEEAAAELARAHPIRCVVRRGARGLSGAVLEGLRHARHDVFVVMDGDLQHPPERIPDLVRRFDDAGTEFVMASRYMPGGEIAEAWSAGRRWASRIACLLARPLAPLTDPMSGFFSLRRGVWQRATRLNPVGYKIALELFVKGRCRAVAEVPFQFHTRQHGESKFSLREQVSYLRHLVRLYAFRFPACLALAAGSVVLGVGALLLRLLGWF
ncbi:MAG: polyprenol monophosphomannose synthase [Phycisphaerales bacterium]|nr:polyprenol monophosphomannose synthase [Phycisphaerales bacterium]